MKKQRLLQKYNNRLRKAGRANTATLPAHAITAAYANSKRQQVKKHISCYM